MSARSASMDQSAAMGAFEDERLEPLRSRWRASETILAQRNLALAALSPQQAEAVQARSLALIERTRKRGAPHAGVEAFLAQYALTSLEGVALMCLAEAMLRTPDAETIDRLIADKISGPDWSRHFGASPSLFVNASSWALMLGAAVVAPAPSAQNLGQALYGLVQRLGAPIVRICAIEAIRRMGAQFVMGESIADAVKRARREAGERDLYSFDMLGESARSRDQAQRYHEAYLQAIGAVATMRQGATIAQRPSVSIKLSALHPRFEVSHAETCEADLHTRLGELLDKARDQGIGLTIDAEESDRLEMTLRVFDRLARDHRWRDWDGLGLAIQAYQKRAPDVVDFLTDTARQSKRCLFVRLVKGAYWDSEIKRAQERGVSDFPVYTRKAATDVSYLACANALLNQPGRLYPQFATHNAHTLAAISVLAGARSDYEFQRLHGMGAPLYESHRQDGANAQCRIYAPVGAYRDLLPYLVRRLLENGANTSFVNALYKEEVAASVLARDPLALLEKAHVKSHPAIATPPQIFGERRNARGLDLSDARVLTRLEAASGAVVARSDRVGASIVDGVDRCNGAMRDVVNPANPNCVLGVAYDADDAAIRDAADVALRAYPNWDGRGAEGRARILETAADLMEAEMEALVGLIAAEAGRTLGDGVAEVREAIDFCRYYAREARRLFGSTQSLPGPAGEDNTMRLYGRGVFVCISPWNFPLAIFVGQVAAALAAGNAVLAKPAEETPIIATQAVRLFHRAGVPTDVLHVLIGDGRVGAALTALPHISGVAFTGSSAAAKHIQRALAAQEGPVKSLIAETGGLNAMIIDSTALLEQACQDVIASSFNSGGQRCSALRLAFVQEDVADAFLTLLVGAMQELRLGDPTRRDTDIGPLISQDAAQAVNLHVEKLKKQARFIGSAPAPQDTRGWFVAPTCFELSDARVLEAEVFGPVLHVVRFKASELDQVVDHINGTGYGLTLGVHSRINATIERVAARARVGNLYVNRNMIGAVVGSQPFGGEGLSGTGPKAGGQHYLARFGVERTISIDTTAIGGNASLLCATEADL